MNYSKIKKFTAVNFRSIGKIEIDMSDSPIVVLSGTNESGKSSVIKALGATLGNLWRTKQNHYIRTGTEGFAGLLELDDDTKVLRKKSDSINSYTLATANGQRRVANKIDVEVPDFIEAVMGLFRDPETRECLQVRTCEDPLLFVDTTDGQNYKAMHNAINNLDVREATNKAKSDVSRLGEEANAARSEVAVYKKQLAELPLLDIDYLKVVLAALERAVGISAKFDEALKHAELVASLDVDGVSEKLQKCNTVDAEAVRLYNEAMRHLTTVKIASNEQIHQCKTVNADALRLFTEALRHQEAVRVATNEQVHQCETVNADALRVFMEALSHLSAVRKAVVISCDNVATVDTAPFALFEKGLKYKADIAAMCAVEVPDTVQTVNAAALPLFEKAREHAKSVAELTASYDRLMEGIQRVTDVLKASGMRVVTCDKCGNDIAVPLEA